MNIFGTRWKREQPLIPLQKRRKKNPNQGRDLDPKKDPAKIRSIFIFLTFFEMTLIFFFLIPERKNPRKAEIKQRARKTRKRKRRKKKKAAQILNPNHLNPAGFFF